MKDFRGKWIKNPKTIKDPEGEIPTIEIVSVDGELCYSPNNRKAISKEELLKDWVPAAQVIQDPYATIKVNPGADLQSKDQIKQFEDVDEYSVDTLGELKSDNITLGNHTKEVSTVIKTTEDESVEGMLIKSLSMVGLSSKVSITTDITIPVDIQILSKLINESPNINAEILVSKLLDKNIDKLKADITKGLIKSLDKNPF